MEDQLLKAREEAAKLMRERGVTKPPGSEGAKETSVDGLWLTVGKASGEKCVRCWHHREDVGSHEGHEALCGRCVTNIEGEGEARKYA